MQPEETIELTPVSKKGVSKTPSDKKELPELPWTIASLKERYGEAEGEEMYCRIAEQGGYFDARNDKSYRPDLHP